MAEGLSKVEVVREIEGWRGDDYFIVSSVDAPYTGFETLVFPADADGHATSFLEVAGGRGMDRTQAILDLEAWDGTDSWAEDDDNG